MEIEMTKRKISGKIDLTNWDLVKLSNRIEKAREKAEKKIEAAIEELFEPFNYDGYLTGIISETAGEALTYAARDQFSINFFRRGFKDENKKPGEMLIEVCFSDYDVFSWKETIHQNIKEVIDGWKEKDGYSDERMEAEFITVANEFRKCADMLEKSIRPKEKR